MKILLYGDLHWSTTSSILRAASDKYTVRLDNLIQTVNWVEQLAKDRGCNSIISLGDWFDKAELTAQEISAIQEIKWSGKKECFIVGNHEIGRHDNLYSTTDVFGLKTLCTVFNAPKQYILGGTEICILPYIPSTDRKPMVEYFGEKTCKRVILSHNDIKGIQMGQFISQDGFSVEEIEESCDLFINGHLHNGMWVTGKILNLGNITGQNFSEDGFKYKHNAAILDTETLEVELVENPYAINFYKLDFTEDDSIKHINSIQIKNAVLTVKVNADSDALECIRCRFDPNYTSTVPFPKHDGVVASRILLNYSNGDNSEVSQTESLHIDHIQQFTQYIRETIGTSDIIEEELSNVIGGSNETVI